MLYDPPARQRPPQRPRPSPLARQVAPKDPRPGALATAAVNLVDTIDLSNASWADLPIADSDARIKYMMRSIIWESNTNRTRIE